MSVNGNLFYGSLTGLWCCVARLKNCNVTPQLLQFDSTWSSNFSTSVATKQFLIIKLTPCSGYELAEPDFTPVTTTSGSLISSEISKLPTDHVVAGVDYSGITLIPYTSSLTVFNGSLNGVAGFSTDIVSDYRVEPDFDIAQDLNNTNSETDPKCGDNCPVCPVAVPPVCLKAAHITDGLDLYEKWLANDPKFKQTGCFQDTLNSLSKNCAFVSDDCNSGRGYTFVKPAVRPQQNHTVTSTKSDKSKRLVLWISLIAVALILIVLLVIHLL